MMIPRREALTVDQKRKAADPMRFHLRFKSRFKSQTLEEFAVNDISNYQKSNDLDSGFAETQNLDSLHSLLVHVENASGRSHDSKTLSEKLTFTIFYLQLLLGMGHEVLPSVVSSLCLLIFGALIFQCTKLIYCSNCSRVRCPPEANPSWR
ncbi:hypothetical protein RIF29_34948 [Crotalaria pallida]|uniref:Uncharacterized protein n=1 Tax=Crotalaria pallida TaxID=3830 RepID=A0AAN9E9W3_CROPI